MKILWIIYSYVPQLNAGAEQYTHNLNKYLILQGHTVCVSLPPEYLGYKYTNSFYEGVHISIADTKQERDDLVEWSDIVLTHLDFTQATMEYVRSFRPVVWVCHNNRFFNYQYIKHNDNASIIYNSTAMKVMGDKEFPNHKSITVHPPSILKKEFSLIKPNPMRNKYITLINLCENKGGFFLKKLADKMRNYSFLAVRGGYGNQITTNLPYNVKVVPNTKNIQEIYNQTRIVIMPSQYESWGMVASEAMENGIPVIANRTFGLEENLGGAGTFAPLDDVDKWIKCIKLLDNEEIYKAKSDQCLERAKEQKLMVRKELKECELFLLDIIKKFKEKTVEVI